MKKCGVKPILDTYVQLAHGVATLQRIQSNSSPPKPRYILEIIRNMDELDDWTSHKNIGILLTVLKTTAINSTGTALLQIIDAARKVWEKTNPERFRSPRPEQELMRDLYHYLLILSMSPNHKDWDTAKRLLIYLKER